MEIFGYLLSQSSRLNSVHYVALAWTWGVSKFESVFNYFFYICAAGAEFLKWVWKRVARRAQFFVELLRIYGPSMVRSWPLMGAQGWPMGGPWAGHGRAMGAPWTLQGGHGSGMLRPCALKIVQNQIGNGNKPGIYDKSIYGSGAQN